ncbi:MAG TPA: nicotinate-nucleotide adenylyltransferase [Dongiaceae bacterium]|nr:nicotinate-nucleotide adenylyltransferase [Dongiaceae bacterium]
MRQRKIGLLGGSFNPAHDGHRDLSLAALTALGLDEVWWLVAPQNPLKPVAGMAPLVRRLQQAKAEARHPRIIVTDIECRLGTRYTADTLAKLVERYRSCRFVWLMGADNLVQIDRWKDWKQIFHFLPIAVFDRPTYTYSALAAKAARRFARYRQRESASHLLALASTPAWMFVHHRLNPISATAIRAAASKAQALASKK